MARLQSPSMGVHDRTALILTLIIDAMEVLMSVTDALNQAIGDLESRAGTMSASVDTAALEVKKLAEQTLALEQQIAQGTVVSAADLDPFKERIASIATALSSEAASLEAASAAGEAQTTRTVYLFSGDPATMGVLPDASDWSDSGRRTPDGAVLYYNMQDAAPGDAKGDGADGGQFAIYRGPVA